MPNALTAPFKSELDTLFNDFCVEMEAKQKAYFAEHSRYWQGIETHDKPQSKEKKAAPKKSKKATDIAETWSDMKVTLPASMPCSLSVNVYQTATGEWGYTCDALAVEDGVKYGKCKNYGTESGREHDWIEIPEIKKS